MTRALYALAFVLAMDLAAIAAITAAPLPLRGTLTRRASPRSA